VHYYQHDLALIHHRGYGQHADRCAPGILELPSPVRGGLAIDILDLDYGWIRAGEPPIGRWFGAAEPPRSAGGDRQEIGFYRTNRALAPVHG